MSVSVGAGAGPTRLGTFSALRQREFGLLWWSGVGQAIGLGMQQITLGYFVFERTHSEFWVGAVAFMNFAPFFFFSLFAGALGDRLDKRRLLIVSQAGSGIAVFALATLITAGAVAIWHILVIAFFAATWQALTVPIRHAFASELVERRYLLNAIALNALAQNGMRVIGPVLAGVLIGTIGSGGTMYVNAAGYLLGLLPLFVLASRPRAVVSARASVLGDIRAGIQHAIATPAILFALVLTNLVFCTFGMPYMSMLPVFAKDVLDQGPAGLGLLSAAGGVGSVLGAVVLARLSDYPHRGRLFQGCFVLFFVSLLLFSLSRSFVLSMALIGLVGLGAMSHINLGTVMLQTATPPEMQGRIMSLWTWGISASFLGALPIGALAEVYGAPFVMAGSAAIGLTLGAGLMLRYRGVALGQPGWTSGVASRGEHDSGLVAPAARR